MKKRHTAWFTYLLQFTHLVMITWYTNLLQPHPTDCFPFSLHFGLLLWGRLKWGQIISMPGAKRLMITTYQCNQFMFLWITTEINGRIRPLFLLIYTNIFLLFLYNNIPSCQRAHSSRVHINLLHDYQRLAIVIRC